MRLISLSGDPPNTRNKGFTLVELMIAVSLLALLTTLAFPSMRTWMRNNQVRTVADALQNGIRMAQTEAVRRNRATVFSLTNDAPGLTSEAVANGTNWAVHFVKKAMDDPNDLFLQGGAIAEAASNVKIDSDGEEAICFNSAGRLTAHASTGVTNATCGVPPAGGSFNFNVSAVDIDPNRDRPLRVTVSLGGQVRMCDINKTRSSSSPDGC